MLEKSLMTCPNDCILYFCYRLSTLTLTTVLLLAACNSSMTEAPHSAPAVVDSNDLSTTVPRTDATKYILPLQVGFYVRAGAPCGSPANANLRHYDGTGLSGSATRDCRLTVLAQNGKRFQLSQDCEDTYTSTRSQSALMITILDDRSFELEGGGRFQYCEDQDLPAAILQERG